MSLRCAACGNRTRFDVFEQKRVRAFHHFNLAGESQVEEEEILERVVEKIVCRWCGAADSVEEEKESPERDAAQDGR